MKYSRDQYIGLDPFEGDQDTGVRLRSAALVRVRKQHECHFGLMQNAAQHAIQPGEFARHEKALIDGKYWGSYYVCVPCMDKWLDELYGEWEGRP